MLLQLPQFQMTDRNSEIIKDCFIPYPKGLYGCGKDVESIRTLKSISGEVQDLLRRYVVIFPQAIEIIDEDEFIKYRCIVHDENTGVTRGILEKLGYLLEETSHSAFNLYAIELKTKTEIKNCGKTFPQFSNERI